MDRTALAFALLFALAPLAGCFSEDAAPVQTQQAPAASAAQAGAVSGEAPAAAKQPYTVGTGAQATTLYPVQMETNGAKPPYANEFTGAFEAKDCLPTGGNVPLLGLVGMRPTTTFDVSEAFAPKDVFLYDVTLTFSNSDSSWAELHLWDQFDNVGDYWNEPTSEGRGEIILNFTGQGFITNEEFMAAVGVQCWFGQITTPIAFTITIDVRFAEGGVPSGQPVLVRVPEGATRLHAAPIALDASKPTTSHYRVFAPDDSLVCECSLSSNEPIDTIELTDGAGDYVVLVDHTENGFLSLALDAAPSAPLRALGSRFDRFPLAGSDGGAIDETIQIEFNSTPLNIGAWVFAPGDIRGAPDAGGGKDVKIAVSNARGDVLRMSMVGYVTFHAAAPNMFSSNNWYAIPMDGDWEFFTDHHAFDVGGHTVTVKAESIRGVATLFAQFYDRAA